MTDRKDGGPAFATLPLLYLEVETMAADCHPTVPVRHLCRLADRVQIWVKSKVNDIEVFIAPGTNEDTMVRQYEIAVDRKAKFVSTNVIPVGERDK